MRASAYKLPAQPAPPAPPPFWRGASNERITEEGSDWNSDSYEEDDEERKASSLTQPPSSLSSAAAGVAGSPLQSQQWGQYRVYTNPLVAPPVVQQQQQQLQQQHVDVQRHFHPFPRRHSAWRKACFWVSPPHSSLQRCTIHAAGRTICG